MKSIVKWIIVGAVIIVIGLILIIVGASLGGSCYGYKESWTETEQSFSEQITVVNCDIDVCNLDISYYDGESVLVTYPESSIRENVVAVNAGILTVNSELNRKLFYNYSTNFPTAVIKIPNTYIVSLDIETDAGEINISGGTYNNLNLEVDYGVINMGVCSFNTVIMNVDAGKVSAENLTCSTLVCNTDAGAVVFTKLTCPNIQINVDAGSIKACLTGSREDYTAACNVDLGSCNITTGGSGTNILRIDVDLGSAEITFAD